jgi:hypothetical protein
MKKITVFIVAVAAIGLLMMSCKSSAKCAAYGETQKFQRETRY